MVFPRISDIRYRDIRYLERAFKRAIGSEGGSLIASTPRWPRSSGYVLRSGKRKRRQASPRTPQVRHARLPPMRYALLRQGRPMSDDRCYDCGGVTPSVRDDWVHWCDPDVLRGQGAAVAFGLMGMAEAIRQAEVIHHLDALTDDHFCNCGDWDETRPETYLCPVHNPAHEAHCPMREHPAPTGGTFCACTGLDIVRPR